jgi:predicted nucleotidyltransferase
MIPLLINHKAELDELCRRYRVRRLEVFGSAVTDRFNPEASDLDFVVEFEPLAQGAYADSYLGLLEDLESLFGRPVDLVSRSAIKNPYFQQSVDQTKALLYAA